MNRGRNHRLFNVFDLGHVGQVHRIVHFNHFKISLSHLIDHTRIGRNYIEIILAADTLLDDFHVQQPEETTAKAESQRDGVFRLIDKSSVIEAQLTHAGFELVVVVSVDWIYTTENHRAYLFVTRQHFSSRRVRVRDGIAELDLSHVAHIGHDIADVTRVECSLLGHFR